MTNVFCPSRRLDMLILGFSLHLPLLTRIPLQFIPRSFQTAFVLVFFLCFQRVVFETQTGFRFSVRVYMPSLPHLILAPRVEILQLFICLPFLLARR